MELDRHDSKGKFYRRKILHVGFNEDYNFFLLQKILLKELIKKLCANWISRLYEEFPEFKKEYSVSFSDWQRTEKHLIKNVVRKLGPLWEDVQHH